MRRAAVGWKWEIGAGHDDSIRLEEEKIYYASSLAFLSRDLNAASLFRIFLPSDVVRFSVSTIHLDCSLRDSRPPSHRLEDTKLDVMAAAASSTLSVPDQIRQLNDARKLVLGDVKYYPSVVRGILPIIGPQAPIELRRWVTDFLAEAFATPALPNSEKETIQPYVLTTLESLIEQEVDAHVLRNVIQTAASIYPLAMRWMLVASLPSY